MDQSAFAETHVSTRRIYEGKIINVRVDDVLLPNGNEATREIVEHNGAACVVPVTDDGKVYMVRQYCYPFARMVLEIPAGKTDPGESPSDAANRELEEEIGMRASELIYMGEFCPSVAYDTEVIHMFLATGLTPSVQHLDDDEFLSVEVYDLNEVVRMAMDNELIDGKTIAAILKAKRILETKGANA